MIASQHSHCEKIFSECITRFKQATKRYSRYQVILTHLNNFLFIFIYLSEVYL